MTKALRKRVSPWFRPAKAAPAINDLLHQRVFAPVWTATYEHMAVPVARAALADLRLNIRRVYMNWEAAR